MANAHLKAKVSLDGRGFAVGVGKAKAATQDFRTHLGRVKTMIVGAFSVGVLVRFGKEVVQLGTEISDMAYQVGLSAEAFQVLAHEARMAGASEEQMGKALTRLKDAQGRVIQGEERIIELFRDLGLAEQEVVELDMAGLLTRVAEALTEAGNEGAAFAAAMQIMGRSTPKVLEALNRIAREGLPDLQRELVAAGDVMSDETVAALDQVADYVERLTNKVKALGGEWMVTAGLAVKAGWEMVKKNPFTKTQTWAGKMMGGMMGAGAPGDKDAGAADETKRREVRQAQAEARRKREEEEKAKKVAGAMASAFEQKMKRWAADQERKEKERQAFEARLETKEKAHERTVGGIRVEGPITDALARIGGFVGGHADPMAGKIERQIELAAATERHTREMAAALKEWRRRHQGPATYGD